MRILVIFASVIFSFIGAGHLVASDQPNFLLVLLDDAGWTDFGCYGSRIQTPRIDQVAAQGMRFTDCHSAAPNCSPSRTGLLTGRIPPRAGIYSYIPSGHMMHLREEEITLAELLKDAGYRTGHFGKWHLSQLQSDQPQPGDQGFDYSLGTTNNAVPSHKNPTNFVRNGQPVGKTEGYSCQIVADEAMRWINEVVSNDEEAPFFACVWFHEPHRRIASPPDLVRKYQEMYPDLNQRQATYFANIENVDRAVGRLMDKLDQLDVSDDTLVFITSDNGPLNRFSREGLRGRKSNVWEGGHRVPGIFRWPDKIEAGSECGVAISGVDYLPTVCDIVGLEPPQDRAIDGASIVPLLEGKHAQFERATPLYWFFYRLNPAIAMRQGDWVIVANTNDAERPKAHPLVREDMPAIKASEPTNCQLYNLEKDLGQQNNLAHSRPKVLERLKEQLAALHQDVVNEGYFWEIPESYGKNRRRRIWNSE